MEFNEVLALRKSVRRYTKEIVSQEDEKAILDAAMASSVGKHNDGGYNLVVVRDREILDLIAKEEKNTPKNPGSDYQTTFRKMEQVYQTLLKTDKVTAEEFKLGMVKEL